MPRRLGLIVLAGLLVVMPTTVRAQQYLVTGELPASLQTANVPPEQFVTATEAHRVRGGLMPSQGVVIALIGTSTYVPNAATSYRLTGGGQSVTIGVHAGSLFFATEGTALLGDCSTVRGVIVSHTSVFNGYLAFQGNPTSAQIVAYPNLFSVQLR